MKYLGFTLLITFFIACDAPQQTRYPTQTTGTVGSFDNSSGFDDCDYSYEEDCNGDDQQTTTGTNGNTTTGSTTSGSGNDEPGFEHCTDTTPFYGGSVGYFGLCRHSQDERKYKSRFAQTDLTIGTCFVPIHIQDGKSYKLGIAECVHNQKNTNYYMTLNKQRSEEINGVMVLKAVAVNSYMQCMNAKANYINSHPGCQYNQQCLAAAEQYAYTVCTSFKQQYQNDYKQVSF